MKEPSTPRTFVNEPGGITNPAKLEEPQMHIAEPGQEQELPTAEDKLWNGGKQPPIKWRRNTPKAAPSGRAVPLRLLSVEKKYSEGCPQIERLWPRQGEE
jgi:hypothetical protein